MTSGIGNPDWQRRYTTSAVPLYTASYNDGIDSVSGILDSNGYQYLLITTNGAGSTVYARVKVDWFQDQNATLQMGSTTYTIPPGVFIVQKIPVATRFFKLEIGNVGGATGHTIQATIYGTNADQENILTQNTDTPFATQNNSVAAGATLTVIASGIFGGEVMMNIDDNVNNLWTAWVEYYNWSTQAWTQFWSAHGKDKGQGWTERIYLPYAPIRMNVRNDDTVAHILMQNMITS